LVNANTCEVLMAMQPMATAIIPSSTGTLSTNGTDAISAAVVRDDPAMKNRRRPVSTPLPFRKRSLICATLIEMTNAVA
jgi:hypothetical protein